MLIEQTIALRDADVTPAPALQFGHQLGRGYTSWAAHGSAFTLANWDAGPARIHLPGVFKPELDAAIRNVKDVVVHMCFTRAFCSKTGVRDEFWAFFKVTGNYQVPAQLGPGARFVSVANAFVDLATAKYPNDPQVAAAARQAFLVDGGLTQGPPPCTPAAPPPPPLPPPPPPPANVAVPDVRGDTPGAANSELTAVGLRIGTQRTVVDDTCNDIGAVIFQAPSAGTVVAPGTAVNVSIGQMPTHPCP